MFVFVRSDYISKQIKPQDSTETNYFAINPTIILILNLLFGIEYYVEL